MVNVRALVGEFVGTLCLVFAGTGAIVADQATGGVIGHTGVALTFGLVIMAMIYTYGDVSGAHFNPAVTIAFCASRRFPLSRVPGYILAQVGGALVGSVLVLALFDPADAGMLGQTVPGTEVLEEQAFGIEVVLTFILMLTIFGVATGAKEKGLMAGIAIGGAVALCALFAGPMTGASMNPARSIGPALIADDVDDLWIYLVAPILGALLSIPAAWASRQPVSDDDPGASTT